jgi:hypothetical protein
MLSSASSTHNASREETPPAILSSASSTLNTVARGDDPTGDVDDIKERDTVVAKAVASGPPTRTR